MYKIKSYKRVSQFLILLGALSGLLYCYLNLYNLESVKDMIQSNGSGNIMRNIFGMIFTGISLLLAAKPDQPLPFHSLLILLLGLSVFILSFFLGGIVIMIAGVLNIIENNKEEEQNEED